MFAHHRPPVGEGSLTCTLDFGFLRTSCWRGSSCFIVDVCLMRNSCWERVCHVAHIVDDRHPVGEESSWSAALKNYRADSHCSQVCVQRRPSLLRPRTYAMGRICWKCNQQTFITREACANPSCVLALVEAYPMSVSIFICFSFFLLLLHPLSPPIISRSSPLHNPTSQVPPRPSSILSTPRLLLHSPFQSLPPLSRPVILCCALPFPLLQYLQCRNVEGSPTSYSNLLLYLFVASPAPLYLTPDLALESSQIAFLLQGDFHI